MGVTPSDPDEFDGGWFPGARCPLWSLAIFRPVVSEETGATLTGVVRLGKGQVRVCL